MPRQPHPTSDDSCEISHIHADSVRRARQSMPDGDTASDLAALFDALGDPTRVRILSALATGPLCVCDLSATLGVSQSAISHQLRLLRALSLVRARREGKLVWYSLDDEHVHDLLAIGFAHVGHTAPTITGVEEERTA